MVHSYGKRLNELLQEEFEKEPVKVIEKNAFAFWLQNNLGVIVSVIAFAPLLVLILINKDADKNQKCPTVNCNTTGIGALTSQIFADNIERMKEADCAQHNLPLDYSR